jgi:hypothetical protein
VAVRDDLIEETVSSLMFRTSPGAIYSRAQPFTHAAITFAGCPPWPAPGSEDTELGVLMELEVRHGEAEVYP